MISQKTQLETKINEKAFSFQCEPSASLQECFEGINVFRSYIFGRIKEAEEAAKPPENPQGENGDQ